MLNPTSPLARLLSAPARPGIVRWIGVRPDRRAPMVSLDEAVLDPATGLAGDRYGGRPGGHRQVTLIQTEHLPAIAAFLGLEAVTPNQVRRNIVVSGINLLALKGRSVQVGEAVLAVTGECHPCSRIEEALGPGGYNAVRGHGGVTARVVAGGTVRVGDAVARLDEPGLG